MREYWGVLLAGLLLALAVLAWAQQPQLSPQDDLLKCQWDVRQLEAGRAQAEHNVSTLGMQLDKAQKELVEVKAQMKAKEPQPAPVSKQ